MSETTYFITGGAGFRVSVIIPVYNQEKFIQDAIDSVLNQTYKDFEIIVVNDGSTDKTEEILREYGDRIRWESQENQGDAVARNSGISMAKGEYITFLDSDDMFAPDKLEQQVSYLDKHPEVGLVYSDYYKVDEKGEIIKLILSSGNGAPLIQCNYVPTSGCMCRAECFDTVGTFEESPLGDGDWDMWVRISERYSIHRIAKPLFKYRIHSKNLSRSWPNIMDRERKLQIMLLKKAYARRGKPAWLKFKIIRAEIERIIGKVHPLPERYNIFFWGCIGSVTNRIERVIFKLRETSIEGE